MEGGIRKAGRSVAGAKKCPVDTFLGRGRIHCLMNAPGTGVGIRQSFDASCPVMPHPLGGELFGGRRDSKGRPNRREGKKQSGGLFLRPWENP